MMALKGSNANGKLTIDATVKQQSLTLAESTIAASLPTHGKQQVDQNAAWFAIRPATSTALAGRHWGLTVIALP